MVGRCSMGTFNDPCLNNPYTSNVVSTAVLQSVAAFHTIFVHRCLRHVCQTVDGDLGPQIEDMVPTGLGKCPNKFTSPLNNYWGYHLQQIFENDVKQIPKIGHLPSGKLTVCYWKWLFIVSFPIKNGGSVCLPEGTKPWNSQLYFFLLRSPPGCQVTS